MRNVALIFPGQGAQKIGMGLEFFQNSPQAKAIFEQADKICNKFENVILCNDEKQLFECFVELIEDSDILSGWNSIRGSSLKIF